MDKIPKKIIVSYTSPQKKFSPKAPLSYEEKLNIMLEYMKETGNPIKATTKYKGYNIGSMRANLRASYWNGTLKISDDLLKAFLDNGILSKEREVIRISGQKKYDFLMSLIGKDTHELSEARMDNGVSYDKIIETLQEQYNNGSLNLTPSQIEDLMKNGFLKSSPKDQEQLSNQYGIPQYYIKKILQNFGSVEDFIDKFKKRECDFDFGKIFVGPRIVTVSSRDLTEEQKLAYYKLYQDACQKNRHYSGQEDIPFNSYLDIDKLDDFLDKRIKDKTKSDIIKIYGLNGEKVDIKSLAESKRVSSQAISLKKNNTLHSLSLHVSTFICSDPTYEYEKLYGINGIDDKLQDLKEQRALVYAIESILMAHKISPSDSRKISELNISDEIFSKIINDTIPWAINSFPDLAQHSLGDVVKYYQYLYDKVEDYIYRQCDNMIDRLENIRKEHTIEKQKFDDIYLRASDFYYNAENIFDSSAIIPAIKREKVEEMPQGLDKLDSSPNITTLQLPVDTIICLHHAGIHTLSDICSLDSKKEDVVRLLRSVDGLDEKDIDKIVEQVSFKKGTSSIQNSTSLSDCGFNKRSVTCLYRRGIQTIDDLINFYNDNGMSWDCLLDVSSLGATQYSHIISKLQELDIIDSNGNIISENKQTEDKNSHQEEHPKKAELIKRIKENQKILKELEQQVQALNNEKNKKHSDGER